mmetsp:Transcript_34605/g.86960  ORF Transcript_34605/g.86960 Transcript_34605/m.86960 type:complete len:220 (-) Transcript_34605:1616-2275(-)
MPSTSVECTSSSEDDDRRKVWMTPWQPAGCWRLRPLAVPTHTYTSPSLSWKEQHASANAASPSGKSCTVTVTISVGCSMRRQEAHLPSPALLAVSPRRASSTSPCTGISKTGASVSISSSFLTTPAAGSFFAVGSTALWSVSMVQMRPVGALSAILRGVYRSGTSVWLNTSPSRSGEMTRSVLPAIATMPSASASDEKGAAYSSARYDSGVMWYLAWKL